MKIGTCTPLVLLICFCRGAQFNSGADAPTVDMVVRFLGLASSSSINMSIGTVNMTMIGLKNSADGLMTRAQTEELRSAVDVIKSLVKRTSDLGFQITGALTKLYSDATTPTMELFKQFECVIEEVKSFIDDESGEILKEIKKSIGCDRAEQFRSKLNEGYSRILKIAGSVQQIGSIVLSPEELRNRDVHPAQLKNLVDALVQNIKDFNDAAAAFSAVAKSTVAGIEQANSFLMGLISKENMTREEMNSTAVRTNSTVDTQSKNAQNKYQAAQLAMKTDLTNAIKSLSIFTGSRKLKNLIGDFKRAYWHFYTFLKKRNRSDLPDIDEHFFKLGNRTANSINQTAEIFLDAVHRTGLRLADVVLEGGSHAPTCYNSFHTKFLTPFMPLTSFVSSCIMKESMRLSSVVAAFDDLLKLLQMSSQELASNLGRCPSLYTNFAMIDEDYVQAKACLKTNLEDMEDIPKVLEPQFQNLEQVIKREAKASIFRIEVCLTTNLHESMAKLKYLRSAIEICAGFEHDCDRNDRHDDEREWHDRKRDHEDNACKRVLDDDFFRK